MGFDENGSGQVRQHVAIIGPACDHHPGGTVCSRVPGGSRPWNRGGTGLRQT